VYDQLPAEERERCGIWADWFGPAGAINHYGPRYNLPRAVSGHITYYLWGPGYSWEEMIIVTQQIDGFRPLFSNIRGKALFLAEHASPISTNIGIFVCTDPQKSAEELWPYVKMFR
jgi:hypothetical protein